MRHSAASAPFVARWVELFSLRSLVDEVAAGTGRVAMIKGEAGVGKTRLLDEVASYAVQRGFLVLRGVTDVLDHERPFAVFAELVELVDGSDDTHAGGPAAAVDRRYAIQRAVGDAIEDMASEQPVLVVLEDLHWADPESLRTVQLLIRRIEPLRVALILTRRPHPRLADLDRVLERATGPLFLELDLGPLHARDVDELATAILGAAPSRTLRAYIARASGNPLFIVELLSSLRADGLIALTDDVADIASMSMPMPASLRATISRRLSSLSQPAVDVLEVASVLGSWFTPSELAAVLGRPLVDLVPLLNEAASAGVLEDDDDLLCFRHDLIREAIYESLPASVRKGLRRHVGSVLAAAGAPLSRVAAHVAVSASPGDDEAVELLHRAAREAAPKSGQVAVELLERARSLVVDDRPRWSALDTDLAISLISVGRLDDAADLARSMLERELDSRVAVPLRLSLAVALVWGGDHRTAADLLRRNLVEPAASDADRADALAILSAAVLYQGDVATSRTLAIDAIAAAAAAGNAFALCLGNCNLSVYERHHGSAEAAVRHGEQALLALVGAAADPKLSFALAPHHALGVALMATDQLGASAEVLRKGRAYTDTLGVAWQLPLLDVELAMNLFIAGRWQDARTEADAGLAMSEETGNQLAFVPLHALRALMAVGGGDLIDAQSSVAAAEGGADRRFRMASDSLVWAKALVVEASQNSSEALPLARKAWAIACRTGLHPIHRLLGYDTVRLAVETGDTDGAHDVAETMQLYADRSGGQGAHAAALLCRGLVTVDVESLQLAVEIYRGLDAQVERARACEAAAEGHASAGAAAAARQLLDEAVDLYDGFGARRDADRAEARLRHHGVRRRRGARRIRPSTGWESLTDTERRVIALLVEGLTNRQIGERLFVSRRTVETHLSHAFRKMRVSTRVELAALAAQKGVQPAD